MRAGLVTCCASGTYIAVKSCCPAASSRMPSGASICSCYNLLPICTDRPGSSAALIRQASCYMPPSPAVQVRVGSLSDPDDLPGLAHFLEHMLFYSSEKYPQEDAYSKFVSEHGGSTNAFTSGEQ